MMLRQMLGLLVLGTLCSTAGAWEAPRILERGRGLEAGAWVATRAWDAAAEDEYAAWIEAIGLAREKASFRLQKGLKDPAVNPLYTDEDKDLEVITDCANFPYALRAYFAYKTRRPFAYIGFTWKRYTADNKPQDIKDWTQFPSFARFYYLCLSAVNSGHFRMASHLEATDTYPVEISPECIRPGVNFYDPNGHLMVVYFVDRATGEIRLLDSHPDGTLTRKIFNSTMATGSARFGGAFRAWRHDRVEVTDAAKGAFRLVRDANRDAYCYHATEQYQGMYLAEGEELTFHEYVRWRLSGTGIVVDPLAEFPRRIAGFCQSVGDRVVAVDEGLANGVHEKPHPGKLPWNIYQADGLWEEYSSPGRDARLRFEAKDLYEFVTRTVVWAGTGHRRLKFKGSAKELVAAYRRTWEEALASAGCRFTYTNSVGAKVPFTVADVFHRLYALSFDPYHCPELRWGAPLPVKGQESPEFATCPQNPRKLSWYKREQKLRNRFTRLLGKATWEHRGPDAGAPADVAALVECYAREFPEVASCDAK